MCVCVCVSVSVVVKKSSVLANDGSVQDGAPNLDEAYGGHGGPFEGLGRPCASLWLGAGKAWAGKRRALWQGTLCKARGGAFAPPTAVRRGRSEIHTRPWPPPPPAGGVQTDCERLTSVRKDDTLRRSRRDSCLVGCSQRACGER